jgi:hypothetical protein
MRTIVLLIASNNLLDNLENILRKPTYMFISTWSNCNKNLGYVLGSHGLGSHLVVPPTGNPIGTKDLPNWDLKTQ